MALVGELNMQEAEHGVRVDPDAERAGLAAVFYAALDAYFIAKGWDLADPEEGQLREAYEAVKPVVQRWGAAMEDRTLAAEDGIQVGSGYGAASRRPFVSLSTGAGQPEAQLRPSLARAVASWLTDAAAVAETDAVFMRWAGEKLDLTPNQLGAMLVEFRAYRKDSRALDLDGGEPAVREAVEVMAGGVSGRL